MRDHGLDVHGPGPRRRAAAMLHGMLPLLTLGFRRRGQDDHVVEAARERDRWTGEQWARWREERLGMLLERAASRVPYYRQQWAERRRRGDRASWSYLENWPVLERAALGASPRAFVADDRDPRQLVHLRTAGTSASPVDLWHGAAGVREYEALVTLRARRWHGIEPQDRGAAVVASADTGETLRLSLLTSYEDSRSLTLSVAAQEEAALARLLDSVVERGVRYLVGRPSVIGSLAATALRRGRRLPGVRVVITVGEALTGEQRCVIGEAFLCPVRESYAVAEHVAAASECWAGRLHEWPEVGITEVLESEALSGQASVRDVVATGLMNPDMPLIRYRVGDCARPGSGEHTCRCGRLLPAFVRIEGRRNELVVAPDGRSIAWLGPMFEGLPIREGQVTREAARRVRLRYVTMPWIDSGLEDVLRARFQASLGSAVELVLERVPELTYQAMGVRAAPGGDAMAAPHWRRAH